MKFSALSFLSLMALAQSENTSLRAGLEFQNDEREAGPLCDAAVRNVKDKLEENLPFTFDCSCTFRFLRPIVYSCSAQVCIQDIKEILGVSQTLPITDASCMNPSASGTLAKRSGDLTTKVCSGSSAIVLDIDQIEAKLGKPIYDEPTYEIVVPSSCLQVSHNVNDLNTFTSCSATIGSKSCGCTPCENGSGVMLDCSALIDEVLPEFLDDALSYTEVCLHPGIYDGLGRQSSDPLALGLFGLILSMDA